MFGEDGWCRSCGVPRRRQTGSLVLEPKGMKVEGCWVPNWQFDALCLERSLADQAASQYRLQLMPVRWHGTPPGEAAQIVVPSIGNSWFDADELRARAVEGHGTAGARCSQCEVWRWMPLAFGMLPRLRIELGHDVDIAASPEWFGDGWKAFRQILVRRDLAAFLARASPRDIQLQEISQGPEQHP